MVIWGYFKHFDENAQHYTDVHVYCATSLTFEGFYLTIFISLCCQTKKDGAITSWQNISLNKRYYLIEH